MIDSTTLLRSATRRAKSDVANKLISMFLHELSRELSKNWPVRVESATYADSVRKAFDNCCPYCNVDLSTTIAVVEHLDGMNRYRVGLHVAGNVLISCKKCNNEKRRDDSVLTLTLAPTGWESFLSHVGQCAGSCGTCAYWRGVWPNETERRAKLAKNLERLRGFRKQFPEFENLRHTISLYLPTLVGKLYSDCQDFATHEIEALMAMFMSQLRIVQ